MKFTEIRSKTHYANIKHTTAMLQVNKEANVGYNAENLKQQLLLGIGCKSADGNVQYCSVL